MPTLSGTFDITGGGEEPYRDLPGQPRLTHAKGQQRFTGGIEGEGSVDWLACYLPDKSARLVGLQRVEGQLGDRRGSFLMEATAAHDGVSSTGRWTVIDGSGTGDLEGITGEGAFEAPGGPTVRYHLAYELDGSRKA